MISQELMDTGALVALEVKDEPHRFREFRLRLCAEVAGLTLEDSATVYRAYFGWDGWTRPTHDMNTGRPL